MDCAHAALADHADDAQAVGFALSLGGRHRMAIYLRLVLDMPWSDVAGEMNLANAESARSLFHKAFARLRDGMHGGGPQPH